MSMPLPASRGKRVARATHNGPAFQLRQDRAYLDVLAVRGGQWDMVVKACIY